MKTSTSLENMEKIVRDMKYKSTGLGGLANWVDYYRAAIPALEQHIKELEIDLRNLGNKSAP